MSTTTGGAVRSGIASRQVTQRPNLFWSLAPIAISVFLLAALTAFRLRGGVGGENGILSAPVVAFYWLLGFEPAFFCSLLVLAWSSIWFLTGHVERPGARIGKILLLTFCLAILVNLRSNGTLPEHGGWIGGFFAERLYSVFGFVLSTLAVSVAAIVLLFKATDSFFIRYFEGLGRAPLASAETGVETQAVDELQSLELSSTDAPRAAEPEATSRPAQPRERVDYGGVRILGDAEPRVRRSRFDRARDEEPEVTPEIEAAEEVLERYEDTRGYDLEDEFELAVEAVEAEPVAEPEPIAEREADEELVGSVGAFDEPDEEFDEFDDEPATFRVAEARDEPAEPAEPAEPVAAEPEEDEELTPALFAEPLVTQDDLQDDVTEPQLEEVEEPVVEHVPEPTAEAAAEDDDFYVVVDDAAETASVEEDEPDLRPDEPVVELPSVPPGPPPEQKRQGALFGSAAADPELVEEAASLVIDSRRASANFLRRRLRISIEEAVEVMDALRERGVIECEPGAAHGRVIA